MNPNTSYKVTPFARKLLAKPIGILFEGPIDQNIAKVKKWFRENSILNPSVICVGDVVSQAFLIDQHLSRFLMMCIVDEKTKQGTFELNIDILEFKQIAVNNPAGCVSSNAIKTIKQQLISDTKTILMVKGEEDLLVLPTILFSQENTFVVYGQPSVTDLEDNVPAGLVMIQVNSTTKSQVKNFLDHFEKL